MALFILQCSIGVLTGVTLFGTAISCWVWAGMLGSGASDGAHPFPFHDYLEGWREDWEYDYLYEPCFAQAGQQFLVAFAAITGVVSMTALGLLIAWLVLRLYSDTQKVGLFYGALGFCACHALLLIILTGLVCGAWSGARIGRTCVFTTAFFLKWYAETRTSKYAGWNETDYRNKWFPRGLFGAWLGLTLVTGGLWGFALILRYLNHTKKWFAEEDWHSPGDIPYEPSIEDSNPQAVPGQVPGQVPPAAGYPVDQGGYPPQGYGGPPSNQAGPTSGGQGSIPPGRYPPAAAPYPQY
jgi:hypothetical protein